MTLDELPELITVNDLCALTGMNKRHARRLCERGVIRAQKLGSVWYMRKSVVLGGLL